MNDIIDDLIRCACGNRYKRAAFYGWKEVILFILMIDK